ncbi:MAG TPA: hypothetical protein VK179_19480 [Bacteroidales bacterium]|nr:hypothetical protein [Bacteroidales bacterium]
MKSIRVQLNSVNAYNLSVIQQAFDIEETAIIYTLLHTHLTLAELYDQAQLELAKRDNHRITTKIDNR